MPDRNDYKLGSLLVNMPPKSYILKTTEEIIKIKEEARKMYKIFSKRKLKDLGRVSNGFGPGKSLARMTPAGVKYYPKPNEVVNPDDWCSWLD